MALPTSGPLGFSDIASELSLSLSNLSLRSMSNTVGFSTPDAVSDFYGYGPSPSPSPSPSPTIYIGSFAATDPCYYDYYDIYQDSGSGEYYRWDGTNYIILYGYGDDMWYEFSYYDEFFMANVYSQYEIDSTSENFTLLGFYLSYC